MDTYYISLVLTFIVFWVGISILDTIAYRLASSEEKAKRNIAALPFSGFYIYFWCDRCHLDLGVDQNK